MRKYKISLVEKFWRQSAVTVEYFAYFVIIIIIFSLWCLLDMNQTLAVAALNSKKWFLTPSVKHSWNKFDGKLSAHGSKPTFLPNCNRERNKKKRGKLKQFTLQKNFNFVLVFQLLFGKSFWRGEWRLYVNLLFNQ